MEKNRSCKADRIDPIKDPMVSCDKRSVIAYTTVTFDRGKRQGSPKSHQSDQTGCQTAAPNIKRYDEVQQEISRKKRSDKTENKSLPSL